MRSRSKPTVDEKTTEEDSHGPHVSTPSSNRDEKIPAENMPPGVPKVKGIPPSALIIRRQNEHSTTTEVKNYESQLEDPPGAPTLGTNLDTAPKIKESAMLRDLTNDRQLKNSETCPDQLTPKLPVSTNRTSVINNRIKKFQNAQNSQVNGGANMINQGKNSISTRRHLSLKAKETIDRDHRASVASTVMKKQASQDQTIMRKATVIDTTTTAKQKQRENQEKLELARLRAFR